MMKKIAILLVSAALLPLVSCEKDTQTPPPTPTNVPVTGVELDITEIGLVVGETAVLTATVLPENATDKTVTYKIEMSEISGNPEYDAARAKWGGTWRMPAHDETLELLEECTWEWVEEQGVPGYKVTGLNGNTIFLPAGGYYDGFDSSEPYNFGTRGYYWSSTPDESSFETAYNFFFTKSVCGWRADFRFTGQNIRPVSD